MALWIGVLLMVFRAVAVSVAENMQRYAQRPEKANRLMNVLGVLLQVISAPVDAIAYSIAPQSMLAPVGMLGMLFNMMAAARVHGDPLSSGQVASTACVAAGTLICLASGDRGDDTPGSIDLSAEQLMFYAAVVGPLCVALRLVPRLDLKGTRFPSGALAAAALCGVLGSSTVVASKILGATVKSGASLFYIVLSALPIAALAPFHLFIMNQSIGMYSLVFMSPASGSSGLVANVSTGFFLYGEVPQNPALFACGVALVAGGVASLCARSTEKPAAA